MAKYSSLTDVVGPTQGDQTINHYVNLIENDNFNTLEGEIAVAIELIKTISGDAIPYLIDVDVNAVTGFQGGSKDRYFAKIRWVEVGTR